LVWPIFDWGVSPSVLCVENRPGANNLQLAVIFLSLKLNNRHVSHH